MAKELESMNRKELEKVKRTGKEQEKGEEGKERGE